MARCRDDSPYVWVTWLPRPLSGEGGCQWSAWFRAHHRWDSWQQAPGDFDRVGWQMDHTAALMAARERWGGRPDLIIRLRDTGALIDVKMGKRHPSHATQVTAYM